MVKKVSQNERNKKKNIGKYPSVTDQANQACKEIAKICICL